MEYHNSAAIPIMWSPHYGPIGAPPMTHTSSSGSSNYGPSRSPGNSVGSLGHSPYASHGSYDSPSIHYSGSYGSHNPQSPAFEAYSYGKSSASTAPVTDYNDSYVSPRMISPYDGGMASFEDWPSQPSEGSYIPQYMPNEAFPTASPMTVIKDGKPLHLCDVPGCTSKGFKRGTDLSRHKESVHFPKYFDCKYVKKDRCNRRGKNGFTRQDHYKDHLREVHCEDIPKGRKDAARRR